MIQNLEFDDLRRSKHFDIAYCSEVGRRDSQQDAGYLAANDEEVFAVVCDGMGGISFGEMASKTAVEAMVDAYAQSAARNELSVDDSWMCSAVECVDDIVYSLKDKDGARLRAGTTLVSVWIKDDHISWVSVGDSRIYIFRGNELVQVTSDHNYFLQLNQQYECGQISREAYREEARNGEALISYIGMGGLTLIDLNEKKFPLIKDDIILLCTDGVYRSITNEQLKAVFQHYSIMQQVSEQLERIIKSRDLSDQDNYTYVLIRIREEKEQEKI